MYDTNLNYSVTLVDMPCCIHALVVKVGDWYYILCNCKMLNDYMVNAILHELNHIKLNHLDNYDIDLRNIRELEVNSN